jgi:hypothetical protein
MRRIDICVTSKLQPEWNRRSLQAVFYNMRKLLAGRTMTTPFMRGGLAIAGFAAMMTFQFPTLSRTALAQEPAPQGVPAPPDSAKPKSVPPLAEAKPKGDPKSGVLKPPDVDPRMAKAVPDVDPAMDNPPPGTKPAPPDTPPPTAKPR